MTRTPSASPPSVSWTARVPRELAEQVEAALPVLGLSNRTEAVVAALRLLRRQAREAAVLASIDAQYGLDGVVPPGTVVAGMEHLLAAEAVPVGTDVLAGKAGLAGNDSAATAVV